MILAQAIVAVLLMCSVQVSSYRSYRFRGTYYNRATTSDTTESDNPWFAYIESNEKIICSGTIIASNWLLTSGDCASRNLTQAQYQVRAGTEKKGWYAGGSVHRINLYKRHPDYRLHRLPHLKGAISRFNLAMVHVVEPFMFDSYRFPVRILSETHKLNSSLGTAARISNFRDSQKLQSANLTVLDRFECDENLPEWPEFFCARGTTAPCDNHDLGAPLVSMPGGFYNARVIGQVAHIYEEDCKESSAAPALFLNLTQVKDWIDRQQKSVAGSCHL